MIEELRASVRPGLAWLFGVATIVFVYFKVIDPADFKDIAKTIILFYFVSRQSKQG